MSKNEHLWDEEGDAADEAFDLKLEEWEERDWVTWLAENLTFPFQATRVQNLEEYDLEGVSPNLFGLGHTMEILDMD
jgi:hypothetical protein